MKLTKFKGNPILSPNPANDWENLVTCNPAAWYESGKFSLLYRAAGNDPEHHIYIGLAESDDGFHFRRRPDQLPNRPYVGFSCSALRALAERKSSSSM